MATLARDIQVEDTATVGIRWRSGALGSINVTMLTYPKNLEGSITIIGERGTARIGGVAVYGFGHPLYYDNVIKALRGEAEPETDGREGLRSLELLIASYISARDGRRVALPLEF